MSKSKIIALQLIGGQTTVLAVSEKKNRGLSPIDFYNFMDVHSCLLLPLCVPYAMGKTSGYFPCIDDILP